MCTSRACWLPSGCGIAALPRKVPSLMSAIEAFTTATIIAFSVSVSLTSAPSVDFNESTLPSAFSIVPRIRTVCAVAAEHAATIIAPASTIRMVLVIIIPSGPKVWLLSASGGGWSNGKRTQSGVIECPSNRTVSLGAVDEVRDVREGSRVILLHGDGDAGD